MNAKEGFFEWIVGYDDIKEYLTEKHTGICLDGNLLKVLVIGCGTSTLSASLIADTDKIGEVVSIDNDEGCINHMSSMHLENPKMSWFTYDLIEDVGKVQNNVLDQNGYFDIIVDKGTFDAIHVEGSVAPLLSEIQRLLRVGGVYLLCSINARQFLESLLTIPSLSFDVTTHEVNLSVYNVATMVLARKTHDAAIVMTTLAEEEKEVANAYFQHDDPLLTQEYEQGIRSRYAVAVQEYNQKHGSGGGGGNSSNAEEDGGLPLEIIHTVIFSGDSDLTAVNNSDNNNTSDSSSITDDHLTTTMMMSSSSDLLAYTYDLFLEDLQGFERKHEDRMDLEEALRFVATMQ